MTASAASRSYTDRASWVDGLTIGAFAPILPVAILGASLFAASAGSFLAFDWALMSELVPKASTGRYMGVSNVATASAGTFTLAIGGAVVMDNVNRWIGYGTGPRASLLLGVACYVVGALLLLRVVEPRREGIVEKRERTGTRA